MFRITTFAAGAAVFLAAHAVQTAAWRAVFEPSGEHAAWFLNSGRAVVFTAACLFFVSFGHAIAARSARRAWVGDAANIAAGACVAMAAVLVSIGPGTIFPIALVVGGLIAAGASAAGAMLGTKL